MVLFRHVVSRRDALVLLLGATMMHVFSFFFPSTNNESIVINTHLHDFPPADIAPLPPPIDDIRPIAETVTVTSVREVDTNTLYTTTSLTTLLPQTILKEHAPGWTIFEDIYMSGGTLFIVTSAPDAFPEFRMMTSTGLPAENTPDNVALREPTLENMSFITPEEAEKRWGHQGAILTVAGNTFLFNDPPQFLQHYYHFAAELFLGAQAFWHGAFSTPTTSLESAVRLSHPSPPIVARAIFPHCDADGWRDTPGFDAYFLRAAFPSMTVEVQKDWNDRIVLTSDKAVDRVWRFPRLLLADRSAAHRGTICGSQTQRTASEAVAYMESKNRLMGQRVAGWWEPVRSAVLHFAGVKSASDLKEYGRDQEMQLSDKKQIRLPLPEKVVVTYISRQSAARRKLTAEAHTSLVNALSEMADRRGFELIIMEAEKLTKDEQLEVVARTTIMVGVHGNGLSHLIFMPPTQVSTVIEIFYPQGFAHDYQWTTHALGMTHFAVWNDHYYTLPNKPSVDYPQGFQENYIPVDGPTVAKLIEDRVDGVL